MLNQDELNKFIASLSEEQKDVLLDKLHHQKDFLTDKYAQKHSQARQMTKRADDLERVVDDDLDFISKMIIHLPQELSTLAVKRIEHIEKAIENPDGYHDNELDKLLEETTKKYMEEKFSENDD